MVESLLTTKFAIPSLRSQLIARPRLSEKFARALEVPLTVVSAPPGFGKTTAVLAALQELESKHETALAWLSLNARDNEPIRFWRYFAASLQRVSFLGNNSAAALAGPQPLSIQSLLVDMLNEIANNSQQLLFVLDDYHLIEQPEIHDGMVFVLDNAPPNLHIVLVTRADPPWSLQRLRVRGQLEEIRANDLRFDRVEATAFLSDVMSLSLTGEEVTTLVEQTEGWVAGLQLAGLALQSTGVTSTQAGHHELIDRLVQNNRYILEYLAEEVLAQQPAEVQSFLLQTSILNPLCGSLCDAVLQQSGSQAMLETLASRNLFLMHVPASGEQVWFRYHQLFAGLLQAHLQQQPDRIADLHQRAAEWYEHQNQIEWAIDHALLGKDYDRVIRLLDNHASTMVMEGHVLTLEQWLHRLPKIYHQHLTRAKLAFAWALLMRGRYEEITPYLRQAEQALTVDDTGLWGEFHALSAAAAGILVKPEEALAHAQKALDLAKPGNLFVQATAQVALGGALRTMGDTKGAVAAYEQAIPLCNAARLPLPELLSRAHLGYLYTILGRLRRAEAVTRPAVTTAKHHPAASTAQTALAEVLLEWNQLDEAEQHLEQAECLTQHSGHRAALVRVQILRARLLRTQENFTAAQAVLDAAAPLVAQGTPSWLEPSLIAEQVDLLLAQDAVDAATSIVQEHLKRDELSVGHVREVLPLAQARVLYCRGEFAEAQDILNSVLEFAEAEGHQGRVIEGLLLRALCYSARGDESLAQGDLQRALELAEPEGYVRVFLDGGPHVAELLSDANSAYARRLIDCYPPDVRQHVKRSVALAEPLTERELDVLRLMEHGLTYQQIADEMVVSINTVRHHVKGIYSKLGVEKRLQALEKARALNLL